MTVPQAPNGAPAVEATFLVVDDSPVDRHLAGGLIEKRGGWKAVGAADGGEALALLETLKPDVIVTDLQMPDMDGLELLQIVRAKFPRLPVVLMTAHGSEQLAIQALQRGAASYVPKSSLARDLVETLEQVLATVRTDRDQQRLYEAMDWTESHFVLENDPSLVAPLVGHLEECVGRMRLCEPSGLILLGVALHEALTNAVYHGNLELSSELRDGDERAYHRLSQERRSRAPYRDRRVHVTATLSRSEAVFVVRDEGPGFDVTRLPDPTDPANLERVSGRGLLLIRTFMDQVSHNAAGNEITMTKRRSR